MSKYLNEKHNLIKRLNRIAGQVNGLKGMIEEDRDCSDIIIQLAAVRSALGQLGILMVEGHMKECVTEAMKKGKSAQLIVAFKKVMKQMMK